MKTVMQELIDYLNKDYEWFVKHSPEHGVLPQIIKKATELLAKEKQDIIDARMDGISKALSTPIDRVGTKSSTDYFTQKYEQ